MKDKDEALEDARVLLEGEFKLDRARAMDKLSRFQLEEPHRYVLELVAAGVRAGAERLVILNDADDFAIEWEGDTPSPAELEQLFEHIFLRDADDRSRMLQHLAQGLHAALALEPKWLHLERPGARFDLTHAGELNGEPHPRRSGTRVHLRERLSLDMLREWLGTPRETWLLREFAACAPIPLEINGEPMPRRQAPADTRARVEHEGSTLWLEAPGASPGVALIRDGLRIEHLRVDLGPLHLAGWWHADHLRLNASRSKVARRQDLRALRTTLLKQARGVLAQHLEHPRGQFEREQIRLAALGCIAHLGRKHLRELADRPLFTDLTGRSFSLEELAGFKKLWLTSRPALASRLERAPQFLEAEGFDSGDRNALQLAALRARFPDRLKNADALLRDSKEGESRRAALHRTDPELPFRRGHPRDFSGAHGLQGSVTVLGGGGATRIEYWVDELPVEAVAVNLPAGLGLRVGGPELRANRRFDRVTRDDAFKAAQALALEQARSYLVHLAEHHGADPDVRALLRDWVSRQRLRDRLDTLPAPLAQAPLFVDGLGAGQSIATLRQWLAEDGRIEVSDGGPAGSDFARVICTDDGALKALRTCFGDGALLNASKRITDHRHAQLRRASAFPRPMRLERHLVGRVVIGAPGLHGELGLAPSESGPLTQVRLFHAGVDLGQLEVDLGLPGSVAILSWSEVQPDARWEAPAHPHRARRALEEALRPFVEPLVSALLASLPTPDQRFPSWLVPLLHEHRSHVEPLLRVPLFQDASGGTWSVVELEARALSGRIPMLGPGSPKIPGRLATALLLDSQRRRALSRRLGESLWDATEWLASWHRSVQGFLARATQSPWQPETHPGLREFHHEGLTLQLLPPSDPAHTQGLKLAILHQQRVLQTLVLSSSVPALARLSGPALQPDDRYQGVDDPEHLSLLRKWWADDCLEQCLEEWGVDTGLTTAQRRLLLARMLPLKRPPKSLSRLRAAPLIATGGERASYDDLHRASVAGTLLTVTQRLSEFAPDDGRLWVVLEPSLRPLLERLPAPPEDGDLELSKLDEGRRNRSRVRVTPLQKPGAWEASALFVSGEARLFVAVAPMPMSEQLTWRVEGRGIQHQSVAAWPPELQVHIEHPGLRANTAFTRVEDGPLLKELRALASQAVAALMSAVCGVLDPRLEAVDVQRPLPLRATLIRYGASRPMVDAVWGDHPLVHDTLDRPITAAGLRALARRGIPVVSPGRMGGGLDPERPLIPASDAQRRDLERWGRLEDAEPSWRAARERDRRLAMEPVQREPDPSALWTAHLEGPRSGFVQVGRVEGILELLHQGRPLCALECPGPVALSGAVEDPRLSPNRAYDGFESDPHLSALMQRLEALSEQAAEALAERPEAIPLSRWLVILQRALPRNRDRRGRGRHPALARLPLFPTGDGQTLSLAELHDLPGEPRWVLPEHATPSLDPEHPFLVASSELMVPLIRWLGGTDAREEALHEAQRLARRDQQGLESSGRLLHILERSLRGGDLELGLRRDLGPGWVDVRCDGIPVTRLTLALPGLSGVLHVARDQVDGPMECLLHEERFRRRVESAYLALVAAAAPQLREGFLLRRRVTRVLRELKTKGPARKAWREAPLLDGPDGPLSPAHAAKGCVWSAEPLEGATCVHDQAANRAFLAALNIRPMEPVAWTALQQRRQQGKRPKGPQVDTGWQRREVKRALRQLSAGVRINRELRKRVLGQSIPKSADTQAALQRFTWEALDRGLVAAGRFEDAGVVAMRAVAML